MTPPPVILHLRLHEPYAHPTNCVTPSHIATTTPGSNDSGKNATQPSNGSTENEHGRISKPAYRYQ